MTTNDEKNSVALNRFLQDVLNARNDLKWIDHAMHHIDRRTRLDKYGLHIVCIASIREIKR